MVKRARPKNESQEPEEAGLSSRPHANETYSDSTCDSGAMEVERIHSALPVLPEGWKTDGAGNTVEGTVCQSHRSDDSDGRIESDYVVEEGTGRRGLRSLVGRACGILQQQKFIPQPSMSGLHNLDAQVLHQSLFDGVGRCLQAAKEPIPLGAGGLQHHRSTVFTTLSKDLLQEQLDLLEGDEKALLIELRALRKDYDARVLSVQQPFSTGGGTRDRASGGSTLSLPSSSSLQMSNFSHPLKMPLQPMQNAGAQAEMLRILMTGNACSIYPSISPSQQHYQHDQPQGQCNHRVSSVSSQPDRPLAHCLNNNNNNNNNNTDNFEDLPSASRLGRQRTASDTVAAAAAPPPAAAVAAAVTTCQLKNASNSNATATANVAVVKRGRQQQGQQQNGMEARQAEGSRRGLMPPPPPSQPSLQPSLQSPRWDATTTNMTAAANHSGRRQSQQQQQEQQQQQLQQQDCAGLKKPPIAHRSRSPFLHPSPSVPSGQQQQQHQHKLPHSKQQQQQQQLEPQVRLRPSPRGGQSQDEVKVDKRRGGVETVEGNSEDEAAGSGNGNSSGNGGPAPPRSTIPLQLPPSSAATSAPSAERLLEALLIRQSSSSSLGAGGASGGGGGGGGGGMAGGGMVAPMIDAGGGGVEASLARNLLAQLLQYGRSQDPVHLQMRM